MPWRPADYCIASDDNVSHLMTWQALWSTARM